MYQVQETSKFFYLTCIQKAQSPKLMYKLLFSAPGPGVSAKDGQWIDGINTFIEDRQGDAHIKKFENIFPPTTTAPPEETTITDGEILLEK